MSRVRACVADLGARWRMYPPRGPPGPCWGFVGRIPIRQIYQESQDSKVSDS